jgi:hypothetical protein
MSLLCVMPSPRSVQDGGYGFDTLKSEIPLVTGTMYTSYFSQTGFAQLVRSEAGKTIRNDCICNMFTPTGQLFRLLSTTAPNSNVICQQGRKKQ